MEGKCLHPKSKNSRQCQKLHKYCSPKDFYNKNNKIEKRKKTREITKLQNLLLVNRGLLVHGLFMINRLGLLKRTALILNRFNLFILKSSLPITLSVGSRVVREQLISAFKIDESGWGKQSLKPSAKQSSSS